MLLEASQVSLLMECKDNQLAQPTFMKEFCQFQKLQIVSDNHYHYRYHYHYDIMHHTYIYQVSQERSVIFGGL